LEELAGHFVNSFEIKNYEACFKRDKEEDKEADPRKVRNLSNVDSYEVTLENAAIKESKSYLFQVTAANAKNLAKKFACTRGSEADPCWMWKQVQELTKDQPLIKEVKCRVGDELRDAGMNLIWNVGKAAASPPRAVMIYYKGRADSDEIDLGIVGKGVTYDTGGLNIKVRMMDLMYGDKGGSCAVLGALKGALDLKLEKNIIFAAGFADNAIGKDAYKPADILTAMNGLTVEIGNTDAEGRLVMADVMTWMQREYKPKQVMYIATLTGACIMAVGTTLAGYFTLDDGMVKRLEKAAEDSFEAIWRLPLIDEHRESIAGKFGADIVNLGKTPYGGASTAAAFLERFVEDSRPWAHIDMAPVGSFLEKDASGWGAKLLLTYINDQIE